MKENNSLRDFMLGAFVMLILITVVHNYSDEYKRDREIRAMKVECEKDLPRSENCVIVAMPKSKD